MYNLHYYQLFVTISIIFTDEFFANEVLNSLEGRPRTVQPDMSILEKTQLRLPFTSQLQSKNSQLPASKQKVDAPKSQTSSQVLPQKQTSDKGIYMVIFLCI